MQHLSLSLVHLTSYIDHGIIIIIVVHTYLYSCYSNFNLKILYKLRQSGHKIIVWVDKYMIIFGGVWATCMHSTESEYYAWLSVL